METAIDYKVRQHKSSASHCGRNFTKEPSAIWECGIFAIVQVELEWKELQPTADTQKLNASLLINTACKEYYSVT